MSTLFILLLIWFCEFATLSHPPLCLWLVPSLFLNSLLPLFAVVRIHCPSFSYLHVLTSLSASIRQSSSKTAQHNFIFKYRRTYTHILYSNIL